MQTKQIIKPEPLIYVIDDVPAVARMTIDRLKQLGVKADTEARAFDAPGQNLIVYEGPMPRLEIQSIVPQIMKESTRDYYENGGEYRRPKHRNGRYNDSAKNRKRNKSARKQRKSNRRK